MGEIIKASLVGAVYADFFELEPETMCSPDLKDIEVLVHGETTSKVMSVLRKPSQRKIFVGLDVADREWVVDIDEASIRLIAAQFNGRPESTLLTVWITNEKGQDCEVVLDYPTTRIFIDLLDQ